MSVCNHSAVNFTHGVLHQNVTSSLIGLGVNGAPKVFMVAPRTVFNRLRSVKSCSTASVVKPEGELEEMINHIISHLHLHCTIHI